MSEQVINPRFRGFIGLTTHPEGCAQSVRQQLKVVQAGCPGSGLGTMLVIGNSTGYGLGSFLTGVFGYGAKALGVCFERPPQNNKTGSPGWYNLCEAQAQARAAGKQVETIVGDAFSDEIKAQVVAALKERFGPVDCIVYSLAAPKRLDPRDGVLYASTLKPVGKTYTGKSIDLRDNSIGEVTIEPASDDDIQGTIKVMGGEDWQRWIELLDEAGLLAKGCRTVAYSYIGPQVTYPIYRSGTIGKAKEHLEATAKTLDQLLQQRCQGHAWVSVNKALVTQASAAIPVVPLYISLLFKVMKAKGSHEGTIEQTVRLFNDHLAPGKEPQLDSEGRIRLDDLEMDANVQADVDHLWQQVNSENFLELADFEGYQRDFHALFGFGLDGIDYSQATEVDRSL
ncbi:MAG: trans-2-enoyl-CoA reductase family protein [Planctomycetota bacterium]|nr:MAG: trans-2-enoyl-CoA reductase family protein [Planctomycetota bacterium]